MHGVLAMRRATARDPELIEKIAEAMGVYEEKKRRCWIDRR